MIQAQIENLFNLAASNLHGAKIVGTKKSLGKGKLFEFYALIALLRLMKRKSFSIKAASPASIGNDLRFALNPAMADKTKFSYFEIDNHAGEHYEAWVSVEVETLSKHQALFYGNPIPAGPACTHEIDIGIYEPLDTGPCNPSYMQLCLGASCKHTPIKKEHVREALGLKRETALLAAPRSSKASWFQPRNTNYVGVPSAPASPMILFSSDRSCLNYQTPVDTLGVYVRYLKFL